MAMILDGKKVRDNIGERLKQLIGNFPSAPTLVVIQIGNRVDSDAYIRQKKLFAEKIGAHIDHKIFPNTVSEKALLEEIQKLNKDSKVHGVIVQMPLPEHINKHAVIQAINSIKDVDGLTAHNTQALWEQGEGEKDAHMPATARGILTLLDYYKISVTGKHVVVIGKSTLVGKPIALSLLNKGATVSVCHKQSSTEDIRDLTQHADIIIVAAGSPKLITQKNISQNKKQVVIDVGINELHGEEGEGKRKIVGDVDFHNVEPHVAAISPVPGGVGPMTVASLFENLVDAYAML